MAHIETTLERDHDLTVFTVVGAVDPDQLLSQIIAFLSGEPTTFVLWDITAGTLERISSEDVRLIVQHAAPLSDKRKGGRTAIVCVRELDYGLSRMFQILAELMHLKFEIEVFRNLVDARDWLTRTRAR